MTDPTRSNPAIGHIPDSAQGFENDRDFRRLRDIPPDRLNPERVDYSRGYARRNFHDDPFEYGWGTEDILKALRDYAHGGAWLDAGAGTSTYFWSLAMPPVTSITPVDVVPEALAVLAEIRAMATPPRCYRDVMESFGVERSHLQGMQHPAFDPLVFDVTQPWPRAMAGARSETITAMGVFALAGTPAGLRAAVRYTGEHWAPGGRLIAANWRRTAEFGRTSGLASDYVNADFLADALERAGLAVQHVGETTLPAEDTYDAVLPFVGERPG